MARQKSTHVDSAAAVGRRIRELREERGLRQLDLAFPGCTAAYISRIEAGARIPSLQLLREIGKRLGVSADYLARGDSHLSDAVALADAQLVQRLGNQREAQEAFAALADSADRKVQKGALLGLAQHALQDGRTIEAMELMERYETLVTNHDPVDPIAVGVLADAYEIRGDLAAAIAFLERKLDLAGGDPLVQLRITVALANALIDLGQFDRAEAMIANSLAALDGEPEPLNLARCLWSQSRLQAARGNVDLAARYAEQAISLLNATEHEEYAARAHQLLAHIELRRGNAERAYGLLEQALPLIAHGRDKTLLSMFRLEYARALVELGQHDDARTIADELLLEIEHLSRVDAARALAVLAQVLEQTGDTERAIELYEAAADALADRYIAPMLIDVYTRWSDLLEQQGDTTGALEVARRALTARRGPVRA